METKRKVRRKKSKVVRTVLHEDCKQCLLKREKEFPLVRFMQNEEKDNMNIHLLTLTHSLTYMRAMTSLVKEFLLELPYDEDSDKVKANLAEYFDELDKMFCMVYKLKSFADERKI